MGLPAHAVSLEVGCPWIPKAVNVGTKNIDYPDSHANYSVAELPTNPAVGSTLIISGAYPQARYFSFQIGDGLRLGNVVDQLADSDLVSQNGLGANANPADLPAANYVSYGDHYTVTIKFTDVPTQREVNTLYAGTPKKGVIKQLLMRIYLPNSGVDLFGGVPLPTLTYVAPDGTKTDLSSSPDAASCSSLASWWQQLNSPYVPGRGQSDIAFHPVTINAGAAGIYNNGDAIYLRAQPGSNYDDMVVVRIKPPVTPLISLVKGSSSKAPHCGGSGTPNADVRYWSICQAQLNNTQTVACLADSEMVKDRDGYVTVVISPEDKKPSGDGDCSAHQYNWLPWGPSKNGFVVIRQILPRPDFAGNFQSTLAQPTVPVSTTLGVWAPDISYCDSATYAANASAGGATLLSACHAAYAKANP